MIIKLKPSDIRFTQDTIKSEFRNGDSIEMLVSDIFSKKTQIESIPLIEVVERDTLYYALDNRRLYVYRRLEYLGFINTIRVVKVS